MRRLSFYLAVIHVFLLSVALTTQRTNVGFAEAAGIQPTVAACYNYNDAVLRFMQGAKDPLIGPIYAELFTQAWSKKGKTYNKVTNYVFTPHDVLVLLNAARLDPAGADVKYGIGIYEFISNTPLTLGTLTETPSGWVPGVPLPRLSQPYEWGLNVWGSFTASSRCLNPNAIKEQVIDQPRDIGTLASTSPAPADQGTFVQTTPTGGGNVFYIINSANNAGGYTPQPQPTYVQPPAPQPQKNSFLKDLALIGVGIGTGLLIDGVGRGNRYGPYSGYGYQQQGHPIGCVCNTCRPRYQQFASCGHAYGCTCGGYRQQSFWPQTDSYYQFVSGGQTGYPGPPPPGWNGYNNSNYGGWFN